LWRVAKIRGFEKLPKYKLKKLENRQLKNIVACQTAFSN